MPRPQHESDYLNSFGFFYSLLPHCIDCFSQVWHQQPRYQFGLKVVIVVLQSQCSVISNNKSSANLLLFFKLSKFTETFLPGQLFDNDSVINYGSNFTTGWFSSNKRMLVSNKRIMCHLFGSTTFLDKFALIA